MNRYPRDRIPDFDVSTYLIYLVEKYRTRRKNKKTTNIATGIALEIQSAWSVTVAIPRYGAVLHDSLLEFHDCGYVELPGCSGGLDIIRLELYGNHDHSDPCCSIFDTEGIFANISTNSIPRFGSEKPSLYSFRRDPHWANYHSRIWMATPVFGWLSSPSRYVSKTVLPSLLYSALAQCRFGPTGCDPGSNTNCPGNIVAWLDGSREAWGLPNSHNGIQPVPSGPCE